MEFEDPAGQQDEQGQLLFAWSSELVSPVLASAWVQPVQGIFQGIVPVDGLNHVHHQKQGKVNKTARPERWINKGSRSVRWTMDKWEVNCVPHQEVIVCLFRLFIILCLLFLK